MPQARCIWQLPGWPKLRFDVAAASPALLRARERQGQVRGMARAVGLDGMHERQRQLIRRLLEAGDGGFLGGLNVDKYLKMNKTSKATATRDLSELVQCGLLHTAGQGKAVRYYLSVPGWTHGREEKPAGLNV